MCESLVNFSFAILLVVYISFVSAIYLASWDDHILAGTTAQLNHLS